MYPLIVCQSCGNAFGDRYDLYIQEMQALTKKELGITNCHPEKVIMNTDWKISAGNILDSLGINKLCCRMRMITNVTFDAYC
jgi:DNA-directed RNA polymerase subunit N (RpoN/RPB10)